MRRLRFEPGPANTTPVDEPVEARDDVAGDEDPAPPPDDVEVSSPPPAITPEEALAAHPQHAAAMQLGCRCWECPLLGCGRGPVMPRVTDPIDLDLVSRALPAQGFTVLSAKLGYRPKNPVNPASLSAEALEEVEAFLAAIDQNEDVQNVFAGLAG